MRTKGEWFDKYEKWNKKLVDNIEYRKELSRISKDLKELESAFSQNLTFGTSGLRGIIGVGTNRMNDFVVAQATRGLCNYIKNKFKDKAKPLKVMVSYDTRKFSKEFATRVAQVFLQNGVCVEMFDKVTALPILSYGIRKHNIDCGVMITASHNNKIYNGYKVYNEKGYQILDDEANSILKEIEKIDIFDEYLMESQSIDIYAHNNMILLNQNLEEEYVEKLFQSFEKLPYEKNINIVYSPLNGTGRRPVVKILEKAFGQPIIPVDSQWNEDEDFPHCPNPNPEREDVYTDGLKILKEQNADILILTDPDSDRIGMATASKVFTGNEIAILLVHYLYENAKVLDKKDGILYKSIVSSQLVRDMSKKYEIQVTETLTGFKYMGAKVEEDSVANKKLFMAFEEGNGVMLTDLIRDKDGISSALVLCKMMSYYKAQGTRLDELLEKIYREFGYYKERNKSYEIDSMDISNITTSAIDYFRKHKEQIFEEFSFFEMIDYKNQEKATIAKKIEKYGNLPKSNVLSFLGSDRKLLIRASGTEPKLKVYVMSWNNDEHIAEKIIDEIYEKLDRIIEREIYEK